MSEFLSSMVGGNPEDYNLRGVQFRSDAERLHEM